MPHRKARTADIEQRLLIDAIYHRYHYDFRGYAQASLKRRLASALVQFDCKTLSQLQDRVLHEPAVFPALLKFLTVQVSDMFRDPSYFQALRQEVVPLLRTYRQRDLEEFAELAGVPVINGLTDYAHPCQVLADLMTIRERRGTLEGQKLCFIGDGCSMANSLIVGGLLAGMRVTCVCPEGYRPAADVLMFAHKYGEKFHLLTDPAEGVKDADVVVTAAWNTAPGTPESERRLRDFAGFQVTSRLMEGAKPDAMLLHCLPAHRGEEISTAVFEEHADEIFDEAENRLHVQKAVLAILLAGL